jgi:hypothetical protein
MQSISYYRKEHYLSKNVIIVGYHNLINSIYWGFLESMISILGRTLFAVKIG